MYKIWSHSSSADRIKQVWILTHAKHWNLILWYSKHNSSHSNGPQKNYNFPDKQPASGAFSEAWPQVEAMWREDQQDSCPSSGSGRRGRTLGTLGWRAGGGGWEGPYRGWGTLFIHETFFGEGRVFQMASAKMFPISASKQSLGLDFRPFFHQILEDYLKLKPPCYFCFWSSLKIYDHKQTMQRRVNQPKARSRRNA